MRSAIGSRRNNQAASQINNTTVISRDSVYEKSFKGTLVGFQNDVKPDYLQFDPTAPTNTATSTKKTSTYQHNLTLCSNVNSSLQKATSQTDTKINIQNSNRPKPRLGNYLSSQYNENPNHGSIYSNQNRNRKSVYHKNNTLTTVLAPKSPNILSLASLPDYLRTPQRKSPQRRPTVSGNTPLAQNLGATPQSQDVGRTPVRLSVYARLNLMNGKPVPKENRYEAPSMDKFVPKQNKIQQPPVYEGEMVPLNSNILQTPRNGTEKSASKNMCWADVLIKEEQDEEVKTTSHREPNHLHQQVSYYTLQTPHIISPYKTDLKIVIEYSFVQTVFQIPGFRPVGQHKLKF